MILYIFLASSLVLAAIGYRLDGKDWGTFWTTLGASLVFAAVVFPVFSLGAWGVTYDTDGTVPLVAYRDGSYAKPVIQDAAPAIKVKTKLGEKTFGLSVSSEGGVTDETHVYNTLGKARIETRCAHTKEIWFPLDWAQDSCDTNVYIPVGKL